MNYDESKKYLNKVSVSGSVYGLETIRELLKRLGNPQDDLKFVHVAGTNGKGSVIAYLSAVLRKAGYCTGCYLSPHMSSYRDSVQVDGSLIEEEFLAKYLTEIQAVSQKMQDEGAGTPTCFEIETALAFMYFRDKQCDIVILETGLGGRQDATNSVNTTVLEIITSISMDHMNILGDTVEKIAEEKAGIIKFGTKAVSAQQVPDAEKVLVNTCRDKNCDLQCCDYSQIHNITYGYKEQIFSYKNWKNIKISLAGTYQIKNAVLALEAVNALRETGFSISDEAVYDGMYYAHWWGRFTQISADPVVILDGAHNEDAARELSESLKLYFNGKRIFYIFGVFKDKQYQRVIELTAPLAEHIITVQTPNNPRALPARELKDAVAKVNPSVEAAKSVSDAVRKMYRQAKKDDIIVIFGSLSFLAEAGRAVLEKDKENE